MDAIRCPEPVRPRNEVSGRVEVVRADPADRQPGGGYIDFEIVHEKADDGTAITPVDMALAERRDTED